MDERRWRAITMGERAKELEGRVALVTGAGDGIGKALVRLLSARGARVVIAEIRPEAGARLEKELREEGREVCFVETDVTDEESVKAAVAETISRYGALHQLANCAGGSIPEDAPATEVDLAVLDRSFALDLRGTILCCRYGIPEIIRAGGGAIVNFGSVVALRGTFAQHMYGAAKGGILSLTRSLAGHYSREGVRVNAVCPGVVLSDRIVNRMDEIGPEHLDDPAGAAVALGMPNHPFAVGKPEDIAEIVAFLLSDAARMINGATIPAEGGLAAY